jgi:Lipoxygenase
MSVFGKIKRLPLQDAGLNNLVAIPYLLTLTEPVHTVLRMGLRQVEIINVQYGLSNTYTINGITATGYEFMYGKKPSGFISHAVSVLQHALEHDPEGALKSIYEPSNATFNISPSVDSSSFSNVSMESPEQFAMAFTNYEGIYELGKPYLPAFIASLTDVDEATKQFWPTLGTYSFVHNFVILEKIQEAGAEAVKSRFGNIWDTEGMDALYKDGWLYALDMTVFDSIAKPADNSSGRYTHATFTLLRQDAQSKALEPLAIWVSGENVDGRARIYTRKTATSGAWLYALQAAKSSLTVCGIFLRHVYLWHVLAATMQMTMDNTLPKDHPVYQMLAPQSKYTIALDESMLLLWNAGKPATSINTPLEYLTLSNAFAKDRGYFDDDPKVAMERLGLREQDFTQNEPWDLYVTIKDSLEIWDATEKYVNVCVDTIYSDDSAVAGDEGLKAWIAASSAVDEGNIRGLEQLESKAALKRLLTSLLYRVIAHGGTNMVFATFLVHLFAPNYPICLQRRDIPESSAELDTKQLLTYLPNAETIGLITSFYFAFAFAKPNEPFIPQEGVEANLFFPSGMSDPRNRALVDYRNALAQFINARAVLPNITGQWPLNVES